MCTDDLKNINIARTPDKKLSIIKTIVENLTIAYENECKSKPSADELFPIFNYVIL